MAVIDSDKTFTCPVGRTTGSANRLTISATMLTRLGTLLREAERTREEKCALLTGKLDETGITIYEVVSIPNRARSNTAFSIAADDFYRADSGNYPVVAVFHTHSRTTHLSLEDVRMMNGSAFVHLVGSPRFCGAEHAQSFEQTFNLAGYANFDDNDIRSIAIEVQS